VLQTYDIGNYVLKRLYVDSLTEYFCCFVTNL